MLLRKTIIGLLLCVSALLKGQGVTGFYCPDPTTKGQPEPAMDIMNGSALIATSYTASACGLNFVQSSLPLYQRNIPGLGGVGVLQPATFTIAGLPQCKTIMKAFLYVGLVGTMNSFNVNFVNPNSANTSVPMTFIGSDVSPCWNAGGSFVYRADVTTAITGNGNYSISGIPTSTNIANATDAEGATLFIVYSDPAQGYTGNIVIADGCMVRVGGNSPISSTVTGFNICGTPTVTSNFMLVGDLQNLANTNIYFNTSTVTSNYIQNQFSDQVWNFITAPGAPAMPGQTSAIYGLQNPSDCEMVVMAGMYYRSGCLACSVSSALNLTVVNGSLCPASATVMVNGGIAPYTYSWTGTSQTGSVISGAAAGSYTVGISDSFSCSSTAVVTLSALPLPTIAVSGVTVCLYQPASIIAMGAQSYSWTTPTWYFPNTATLTVQSMVNTQPQTYTVTATGSNLCTSSTTVVVAALPLPTVSLSSVPYQICKGQNAKLTAIGAITYSWLPVGLTSGSFALVTPSVNLTYTVQGFDLNGCSNTVTTTVSVYKCTGIVENSNGDFRIFVYPNPATGNFTIESDMVTQLTLVDVWGQNMQTLVLDEKNNFRLSVCCLTKGIYYLISVNPDHQNKQKIIVE